MPTIRIDNIKTTARDIDRSASVTFCKTTQLHGTMSNMCRGFPIPVAGESAPSSEALYQALKFPDHPAVQKAILRGRNAYDAKQISRAHVGLARGDWRDVSVATMAFVLEAKLAAHRERFGADLLATGASNVEIVEWSRRDAFWGAGPKPGDARALHGANVLGQLLTGLREAVRADDGTGLRTATADPTLGLRWAGQPLVTIEGPPGGAEPMAIKRWP